VKCAPLAKNAKWFPCLCNLYLRCLVISCERSVNQALGWNVYTPNNTNKHDLIDSFGRRIEYVRLSVTDQCDLRCFYCLPKGYKSTCEPEQWLSFDEIERVITSFARLGVKRVRITGGEPLLRRNLSDLLQRLHLIPGIEDLSLSTNAVRLGKMAEQLKQAGVSRINVSLDSLQPDRFRQITGGKLEKILNGLHTAKSIGLQPVKINMVVMKGINDDEVFDMVAYCIKHKFTLRFIETMPMGATGQTASAYYVNLKTIKEKLARHYSLLPSVMPGGGPARYARIAGTDTMIGFITPISQHFCDTCNRVRLSADGSIYLCLGQNDVVPLRHLLRSGINDAELTQLIYHAIQRKPLKHDFNDSPQRVVRFMAHTGG
jgi:GTP 3',8-cyclase